MIDRVRLEYAMMCYEDEDEHDDVIARGQERKKCGRVMRGDGRESPRDQVLRWQHL